MMIAAEIADQIDRLRLTDANIGRISRLLSELLEVQKLTSKALLEFGDPEKKEPSLTPETTEKLRRFLL